MSQRVHCTHCRRIMGDFDGGWASINGAPVCHPNDESRPDCYRLCTVNQHQLPCTQQACLEDMERVKAYLRDSGTCLNCDGRWCMGCVFRDMDHDCADDCPTCCITVTIVTTDGAGHVH